LACGGGHFTKILRSITKGKVYGADISEKMIEIARQDANINNLDI
jgi:2-polyprenyl-3-methyl-5-hydroxy-6-metoxy-1,4-benzoquinol methylase